MFTSAPFGGDVGKGAATVQPAARHRAGSMAWHASMSRRSRTAAVVSAGSSAANSGQAVTTSTASAWRVAAAALSA